MSVPASGAPLKPITHRRVVGIAFPIVISNATVPILGAVDTGVVGQMGLAAPIGAVGIGAIILTAIYWIFGFLRMGTTGLVGQAIGAGDRQEVSALLSRALLLALGFGLFLIVFQKWVFDLSFMVSPASEEVESLARDYMSIRIWSAPAAIAVYGLTGWLIAQERTKEVFFIQLLMNGTNILLDLLFVLQFGWGVEGVAIATFIAEWSGAALGLWYCREAFANVAWRTASIVFDRARVLQMANVNTDIMIRSLLLQAIFVSFLFYGADFGDVTLAANQILLQFLHITAYALDGFAFAAEAIVAQGFGAAKRGYVRRGSLMTIFWGVVTVTFLAACFAVFGPWIIDVMTTNDEVRLEAKSYLGWMIVAPLVGVMAWMLDGIFIGATRSRDMRNMMAISAVIYFAAVYSLIPVFGNHGLWMALLISFVARGITLGLRYPALERASEA